jgi:hypothetical protein
MQQRLQEHDVDKTLACSALSWSPQNIMPESHSVSGTMRQQRIEGTTGGRLTGFRRDFSIATIRDRQ